MSKKGRKPLGLKPENAISQRLAEYIDIEKISDYSANISIDPSEFRRIVQGKVKTNYEKWVKILEAVGEKAIRNSGYILTGREDLKEDFEAVPLPNVSPDDFYEVPFYSDEIAAGTPLEMRDNPVGVVIVHRDWCKHPDQMTAVRVASTGDSMEPTIPAGAIVTIDHSFTKPEYLLGKVVAIYKADDGCTIKRLGKTDLGWCGIPDNRNPKHEIITINEGDRIIGKVNSVHYSL